MDILKYPTTRYVTLAGVFTKFTDMSIGCFIPIFFLRTYPSYKNTYACINAAMLAILGFTSNILGGLIGDRAEGKDPNIKGKICTYSALISCPLLLLTCLGHGNFWLSFIALSLNILFTGGQASAAITMM